MHMAIEALSAHVAPIRKSLGAIPGEPLRGNGTRVLTYNADRKHIPKAMMRPAKKPTTGLRYAPAIKKAHAHLQAAGRAAGEAAGQAASSVMAPPRFLLIL